MGDVFDLLGEPVPEYDWKIPGIVESGDRVLTTGGEGGGKSTLHRQIGVQTAAGIHPFTLAPMPACRVLNIDLENSRRQLRREYAKLVPRAGDRLARGMLRPVARPEGLNLLRHDDQKWLISEVEDFQPDLLFLGPIYKMFDGDPIREEPAAMVTRFLDRLRTDHRFALFLEAHTPYAGQGFERPIRPYGASLWSRWPEFGLHLAKNGNYLHFRGPRDHRDWPVKLERDGEWLWNAPFDHAFDRFARACEWVTTTNTVPSVRELAVYLGCSKSETGRMLKRFEDVWQIVTSQWGVPQGVPNEAWDTQTGRSDPVSEGGVPKSVPRFSEPKSEEYRENGSGTPDGTVKPEMAPEQDL